MPIEHSGWPVYSVEPRPIAGLIPYARNARTHSADQVAALVRVASLYGEREAIWSRVSWQVLGVLAAPAMPSDLRTEYEARIEAGEVVTAKEIAARRKAFPRQSIGQPRSRS